MQHHYLVHRLAQAINFLTRSDLIYLTKSQLDCLSFPENIVFPRWNYNCCHWSLGYILVVFHFLLYFFCRISHRRCENDSTLELRDRRHILTDYRKLQNSSIDSESSYMLSLDLCPYVLSKVKYTTFTHLDENGQVVLIENRQRGYFYISNV